MQKLLYLRNSMNDLHNIWHDNAEHVSSVSAVKIFFLNPRWQIADALERPIVCHEILWFFDFKMAAEMGHTVAMQRYFRVF